MKNLKTYEGFFDFFRKKQKSEDDKIIDMYITRLKRVKGICPYKIEFDDEGTEEGEMYYLRYKVYFDDVTFKIGKAEADRKYSSGWNEETQKGFFSQNLSKKNNNIFYGMWVYPGNDTDIVDIKSNWEKLEELYELTEEVYKNDKEARRIKKIKDEINPAADRLDPDMGY